MPGAKHRIRFLEFRHHRLNKLLLTNLRMKLCFIMQPILASQELITKAVEYSYLSSWLGNCMFLMTGED